MDPDDVAADLHRRFESGEFPPGSRLPSPGVLGERYAATGDEVRRALAILAGQGAVSEVDGIGFVVGDDGTRFPDDDIREIRERLARDAAALKAALAENASVWRAVDGAATGDVHTTEATSTVELCIAEPDPGIRRVAVKKAWSGGLVGTSEELMLSVGDPAESTAGFVALEIFEGSLDGHKGGLALQYYRTMRDGEDRWVCEVVPGSGTGELTGIFGSVEIRPARTAQHARIVYGGLAS
jgi:DNA-binding transcriptional regulator YhcF (GntR family)